MIYYTIIFFVQWTTPELVSLYMNMKKETYCSMLLELISQYKCEIFDIFGKKLSISPQKLI